MKFCEYDGKHMEDWGTTMSTESKEFFKAFKAYLKKNLPNCELTGFRPNHYDTSGFVTRPDGKIVYVSYSLDRLPDGSCVADFDASSCKNGVLYRTAESTKDYRGGMNHFTSLNKVIKAIVSV